MKFFPNRNLLLAGAMLATVLIGTHPATAVDSSRVSAQSGSAPSWATSPSNTLSDPYYGSTLTGPAARERDSLGSAEGRWNDPLRTNDPLRPDSFYGGSYEPNVVGQPQALQKWRLGIYPQDTETGVVITEVIRGSAAERAGLEVNDRIVGVHGYQVGYVNGNLYDVGQEFERHADDKGWVSILVQNHRNGKLLNMPLQLDPRQETISGSVTYRDRSNLPRDAVLTVELRENLRNDLRPITIAQQSYSAGRQVPIPFTLEYDPTQVDSRRRYVLYAEILSGGRQLYTMRQEVPVLNGNQSSGLQLVLDATGSFPSGGSNINEQMAQISRWFREYLRREPRQQELYVWEAHLQRGGSLQDAQLQILSTPEFYYQSNADDSEYIRRMFQLVTERQPSSQEVSQWLNRLQYHNRMRPEVAREFLAMANSQATRSGRR